MHILWTVLGLLNLIPTIRPIQQSTSEVPHMKPVIRESPVDTFSADGVLEFTCQAEGHPKPIITWYDALTGQKVIDRVPSSGSTTGIHVNQHYGRLMVSNPIRNKIYSFYCNASNSVGWTTSNPPVRGGLAYLESSFRRNPVDKRVNEGDRVLLECIPPVGLPEPKVAWFRHGVLVAAQHGFPVSSNSTANALSTAQLIEPGNLQIPAASMTDSGDYVCVAANAAGQQQSASAGLSIIPRARFVEKPTDVRVRKGENVKFKCRVEGNQMVKWSRGPGEGLIDPSRIELTEGYLLLKNVQLSDAGLYVCTAMGSISADAILTVETPPTFSRTPDDLTVMVGNMARFHCVTTGYPQPSIYWELPDKTPIFPTDDSTAQGAYSRFNLHTDGTLEVRNVQESDAGKYQCTAHSSIDRVHSSALLHVVPRPRIVEDGLDQSVSSHGSGRIKTFPGTNNQFSYEFYPLAPVIGLPPVNQTRLAGDLVILDCELGATRHPIAPASVLQDNVISGSIDNPVPISSSDWSVTWQRTTLATKGLTEQLDFSKFVREQRYSLLPGGSLQIFNAQLTDTGVYTCSAQTWIHNNPNSLDHTPLLLQSNWTAHLNIVPQGSSVQQSEQGRENPLSPPRDLRVTNVTESTITLAWEPSSWLEPVETGPNGNTGAGTQGAITYWVEFYRPNRATDGWRTVEQNWPANTVQIGGLQSNTAYYFLIRPRWRFGRVGWASAPLGPIMTRASYQPKSTTAAFLVDKELLNAVRNVEISRVYLHPVSPRRMRVSWTVLAHPKVLSVITGYTIHYRKINLMQCVPVSLQTIDNRVIPTDLGDSYCSLRPAPDGRPLDLYRELQEMQRLRQQLVSVDEQPRQQLEVKANYPIDSAEQPRTHTGQIAYEGSGLIRDLDPFHCYEVSVKPHSANEIYGKTEGRESVAHTALTFESFPSRPPERVAARWIASVGGELELSWSAPPVSHWSGLLQGYTIYVYDELAREHQIFNVSSKEQKTMIKGLTGPNAYLIQMAAGTCKGVGLRSKPLRLDPSSVKRQAGYGVGWGFDPNTGLALVNAEGDFEDLDTEGRLIHKPWFIVTMISSLLLWFALIGLITFCCRRQPYVFRKTTGGVLIANSSHSTTGTVDGLNGTTLMIDPGRTTNINGHTIGTSRYATKERKSFLQLEPLIQKTPTTKSYVETLSDMDCGVINASSYTTTQSSQNPFLVSLESSVTPAYGLYSLTSNNNNDMLQTQWASRPGDTHPNHGTVVYPLLDEGASGGPYATANNSLVGHRNPVCADSLPPNSILFHPNGNMINYSLGFCSTNSPPAPAPPPPPPAYLTYQPAMVPLSQSISEFSSPDLTRDQTGQRYGNAVVSAAVSNTTGLPPIAPVAQLGYSGARISPPSIVESIGSATSVAPYATASIIKNVMIPERGLGRTSGDACFRPGVNLGSISASNGLSVDGSAQTDKASYSSGDSNRSYSNQSDLSRTNPVAQRENCVMYGRGDGYLGSYPGQEIRGRASTPGKSPNPILPSRTTSSNPSKSESNASTSTRLSSGGGGGDRSTVWPNSQSSMGKMAPLEAEELSGSGYHPEEDVYSLADDSGIPPPPASPPPPAPSHGRENNHFDAVDAYSHGRIPSQNQSGKINNQSLYDMNAESSEEETNQGVGAGPPSSYSGKHHDRQNKDFIHAEIPGTRRRKNPSVCEDVRPNSAFNVALSSEEPQNTTYAQVY